VLAAEGQPDKRGKARVKTADYNGSYGHKSQHYAGIVHNLFAAGPNYSANFAAHVSPSAAYTANCAGLFLGPCVWVRHCDSLLLCFFMGCVFTAKAAKLAHFQTIGVVFLVLHGVVVALLALGARKCDFNSQRNLPPKLGLEFPAF